MLREAIYVALYVKRLAAAVSAHEAPTAPTASPPEETGTGPSPQPDHDLGAASLRRASEPLHDPAPASGRSNSGRAQRRCGRSTPGPSGLGEAITGLGSMQGDPRSRSPRRSSRTNGHVCNPHSPWQRGSNENTNGLLRQWFPRSTVFYLFDRAHIPRVRTSLNHRPRQIPDVPNAGGRTRRSLLIWAATAKKTLVPTFHIGAVDERFGRRHSSE